MIGQKLFNIRDNCFHVGIGELIRLSVAASLRRCEPMTVLASATRPRMRISRLCEGVLDVQDDERLLNWVYAYKSDLPLQNLEAGRG